MYLKEENDMSKLFGMPENDYFSAEVKTDQIMAAFNKKEFKKGKPKKMAEKISGDIAFLIMWYFNHKKKDDKYTKEIASLFTSKKFIKAMNIYISKVVVTKKDKKKSKEKCYDYPVGLVTMLMDIRSKVYDKLKTACIVSKAKAENAQTKRSAIAEADMENKEYTSSIMNDIDGMIHVLAKPKTKECIDAGFEPEYAEMLAPTFVDPRFLNKNNIGIYVRRFNSTLMHIQKVGTTINSDGWTNQVGASLGDPEDGANSITALYEEFFKGVDREIFIEGIIAMLLEYRNENLINNNIAVAGLNNCINTVILELLEGRGVINYSDGKEKDKKMRLTEKESRKIIRKYIERRYEAIKRSNDIPRRFVFKNLDAERYPFITKWYGDYNDDAIADNIEDVTQPQQNNGNGNNQSNNGNRPNNNRNNNNRR